MTKSLRYLLRDGAPATCVWVPPRRSAAGSRWHPFGADGSIESVCLRTLDRATANPLEGIGSGSGFVNQPNDSIHHAITTTRR